MVTDASPFPIETGNSDDNAERAAKRTKVSNDAPVPEPSASAAWVPHRDPTPYTKPATPTIKAYKNVEFLGSSHCRSLRMMVEYEETMQRLAANGIKATVQFFGSARALDREQYNLTLAQHQGTLKTAKTGSAEEEKALAALKKLESVEWMVPYIDQIRELARRLTEWSINSRLSKHATRTGVSRTKSIEKMEDLVELPQYKYLPHHTDAPIAAPRSKGGLYVCTGGAGGFMEAANRGASDVPGGRSIGMGISLPFETGLNPYVTPELAFEYHYFFTRKLCMAFHMQALVVAPGGFGTCDEMFEMMTLKQTGKMQSNMPVVLFGKAYWERVIDWEAFKQSGTINNRDVDELLFTDSVDEAFEYITNRIGSHGNTPR